MFSAEAGFQVEGALTYPARATLQALIPGLLDVGFTVVDDDGDVLFRGASGSDSFTAENVLLTRLLRTLGAVHPDTALAALTASTAWSEFAANLSSDALPIVRGMVESALLPGESLTSSPEPPADGSLLAESLPAAVNIDGGASARFRGRAFTVSGRSHLADGVPIEGITAHAVVATSPDAIDAILGALSDRQMGRLDGGVVSGALPVRPSPWADALATRADLTLSGRVRENIGSSTEPVIAYAPDGIEFSGTGRGWGILIVDGPFTLRGSARWTGVVLVRGGTEIAAEVDVTGTPSVVGAIVLADGASLEVGGRAEILYSPQAIRIARSAALHAE